MFLIGRSELPKLHGSEGVSGLFFMHAPRAFYQWITVNSGRYQELTSSLAENEDALSVFQHGMKCQSTQFSGGLHVEFLFEMFAVCIDCVRAQKELIGNCSRRQAFTDQAEDFFFTVSEAVHRFL